MLAQDLYIRSLVPDTGSSTAIEASAPEFVLPKLAILSASSQALAEEARKEELALRTDEMRWQREEQSRADESGRLHQQQEAQWLKWQEALRRKTALQDEIAQIDQSAKALQVMVQELRDHRDQAKACVKTARSTIRPWLRCAERFPWPAQGKVVQITAGSIRMV